MTALAKALLEQLEPEDLRRLAEQLQPYLRQREPTRGGEWLNSRAAAEYLGISLHALHRLTAERRLPFSQSGRGRRCYFRRRDLNEWREQ